MKTSEAAHRLGVSPAAIRAWTLPTGPYADFMSSGGRGGKRRDLTDQDVRILARVVELSASRMTQAEVAAELEAMRADGWRGLPALPPPPAYGNEIPTVSADAAAIAIDKTRDILMQQIRALEGEISRLEDALHEERQERRGLQIRLEDAIDQRANLAGRLTALEVSTGQQVQALADSAGRERALYTAVLIAAAVLAVVLLAAVVYMAVWGGA